MKNPVKDINKRIDELESYFLKRKNELEILNAEVIKREKELVSINGGLIELKKLLQIDNILKDAEVVSDVNITNNKSKSKK